MYVLQTGWQIAPFVGNPYDTLVDCQAISEYLINNKIYNWPGGVKATNYACQKSVTGDKDAEKNKPTG